MNPSAGHLRTLTPCQTNCMNYLWRTFDIPVPKHRHLYQEMSAMECVSIDSGEPCRDGPLHRTDRTRGHAWHVGHVGHVGHVVGPVRATAVVHCWKGRERKGKVGRTGAGKREGAEDGGREMVDGRTGRSELATIAGTGWPTADRSASGTAWHSHGTYPNLYDISRNYLMHHDSTLP